MPGDPLPKPSPVALANDIEQVVESESLALHAEAVTVSKRARRTLVRATRTTRTRDVVVAEDLARDEVVVERVPIGKVVGAVPPVRQEGDVTIMSVVEEEVVVTRRLILKEEVRVRRVRTIERFTETLPVREQQVAITRTDLEDEPAGRIPKEWGLQQQRT